MVLESAVGQYITLDPSGVGYPASLMGTISYIRQVYLDAGRYQRVKQDYAADPRGKKRPDYDRALEGVLQSQRILLPADSRVEIDRMLHFAAELKQPAILYGLEEGYRSVDLLKAANATVLISLKWPERPRDSDPAAVESLRTLQNRDQAPSTPAELAKGGVRLAFYTDGTNQPRDIQKAVKKAIDAGLSRDDAVRAMTLLPAQIFGVDDRLGSIERGKIANMVLTRGEIFDDKTNVAMVFIDGRQYRPPPEPAKPEPAKPKSEPPGATP
jgi:imidazolonepropionase-like amidohydrolase